jgi:hypothetical protein
MVSAWDAWADRHDLTGVRGGPYWAAAAMAVWMVVLRQRQLPTWRRKVTRLG